MSGPAIILPTGDPAVLPVQCYLRGGLGLAAAYNASDVLTAAVVQNFSALVICTPAVSWYTALSTQSGYGQGQVSVAITNAQAVLLLPTTLYTLIVYRALAASPTLPEIIARVPLWIEPLPVP